MLVATLVKMRVRVRVMVEKRETVMGRVIVKKRLRKRVKEVVNEGHVGDSLPTLEILSLFLLRIYLLENLTLWVQSKRKAVYVGEPSVIPKVVRKQMASSTAPASLHSVFTERISSELKSIS